MDCFLLFANAAISSTLHDNTVPARLNELKFTAIKNTYESIFRAILLPAVLIHADAS